MIDERRIAETAWALLDRSPAERRKVFTDAHRAAIRHRPYLTDAQIEQITIAMTNYVAAVYREIERLQRTRGSG
jgi:hypothetical protein